MYFKNSEYLTFQLFFFVIIVLLLSFWTLSKQCFMEELANYFFPCCKKTRNVAKKKKQPTIFFRKIFKFKKCVLLGQETSFQSEVMEPNTKQIYKLIIKQ